jgi:hypothetical protein
LSWFKKQPQVLAISSKAGITRSEPWLGLFKASPNNSDVAAEGIGGPETAGSTWFC